MASESNSATKNALADDFTGEGVCNDQNSEFTEDFAFLDGYGTSKDRLRYILADKLHRPITHNELAATSMEAMEAISTHVRTQCTRTTVCRTVVKRTLQPVLK
jgi:hypothetical protein